MKRVSTARPVVSGTTLTTRTSGVHSLLDNDPSSTNNGRISELSYFLDTTV